MASTQTPALSPEAVAGFHRDGFVHVPSVLSMEQVSDLRDLCRERLYERELAPGDGNGVLLDVFNRHEELRELLIVPAVLATLRATLGRDFVLLPESAVHHQKFGGWHKDTSSQERDGEMFQWALDYLQVEVAFYLQDNTDDWAGGLDLEPGSHRRRDGFVNPVHRVVGPDGEPVGAGWCSIPNRAGDLVVFDFRVNHRATQPDRADFTPGTEKWAIFAACSTNTPHVANYRRYISTRPDYADWLAGFRWHPELVRLADEHGFGLG